MITYRGQPIRIAADISTQTLKAKMDWNNIFQSLEEHRCQPEILYPAKLTFRFEDEIKSFHDKQKLQDLPIESLCYRMFSTKYSMRRNKKQQCRSAKGGTTLAKNHSKEKPSQLKSQK